MPKIFGDFGRLYIYPFFHQVDGYPIHVIMKYEFETILYHRIEPG